LFVVRCPWKEVNYKFTTDNLQRTTNMGFVTLNQHK